MAAPTLAAAAISQLPSVAPTSNVTALPVLLPMGTLPSGEKSGSPATKGAASSGSRAEDAGSESAGQKRGGPLAGAGQNEGAQLPGSPPKAPGAPLSSLNERLKALNTDGDVDYRPHRVKIGDAQSVIDRAMNAYDAALAPSADILRRTFGYVYERRTILHPDSIAYIFDSYAIGPIRICKAWKIVEHPYETIREVGPVAGSAGIGGAVATNANSPVVRHDNGGRAEASVVQFPCSQNSYTAIAPGSLTTPLPRHPDFEAHPTATPSPAPTLAP